MSWKEEIRIEKGVMDKVKAMIKKMKDASFKRKLRKFLRRELVVKYSRKELGLYEDEYTRETPRQESIEEAKEVLLQVVEEVFDKAFPTNYIVSDYPLSDEM